MLEWVGVSKGKKERMEQKMLRILQNCKTSTELMQTHHQILIRGLGESNLLLPKLIDVSSSVHSLGYAVRIFGDTRTRNIIVYNNMIKCFAGNRRQKEAFSTYDLMRASGISPNNFTLTFLLKACDSIDSLEEGKEIHAQIIRSGYGFNVFVQNTLLDFYSKCSSDLNFARRVFDEMTERDVVSWNSMINAYMTHGDQASAVRLFNSMPERNVVSWNSVITGLSKTAGDMDMARSVFDRMTTRNANSWNAMIAGYVMHGDITAARSIFDQMEEKSVVSWTAMISGYTKIGDTVSASTLFDQMPVKNVVSWNAIIAGYSQNRQFDRALRTFHQMLIDGNFMPDEVTLITVVSACGHLGALEHGNWVHSYVNKNKFNLTAALGNALIDMFAKCGDVNTSKAVFRQMTRRCIITWTTMVSGLAINGRCREAFALYGEMCRKGIKPDYVIFIAVLSACTHGGLVEEGRRTFDQMVGEFGIEPRIEHYGCMVDLLGRAGKLEEAMRFIRSMPFEPNVVIWATLLGSCKKYGTAEMVESVSRKIAEMEPSDPGYQVLISNTSASMGRWEGVSSVRESMRRVGIEKVPGCSSIQVGIEVHEFLVKDLRHERRREIYDVLDGLTEMVRQAGYMPSCRHQITTLQEVLG